VKESTTLREGDVFCWHYKNDEEYRKQHQQSGTAYWCLDNKCVVVDGELQDTYWSGPKETQFRSNDRILDIDKVDLEFICNVNDVEVIEKWQTEDYDKVYNLSYQKGCYKLFAIDKDAKPSNKALIAKWERKLEEAESDKRSAEFNIKWAKEELEKLKS
jgi:hypothetical protein